MSKAVSSLAKDDAYLRSVEATVLTCTAVPDSKFPKAAVGETLARLNVIDKNARHTITLDKTVFYPIGGGQPSDVGIIGGVRCEFVEEVDDVCVHWCDGSLPVDTTVTMTLDWERRWYNMQHHTMQHILSAIAFDVLKADTVSWDLAADRCDVEFSLTKAPEDKDIRAIEEKVNEAIRRAAPVRIASVPGDDSDGQLSALSADPFARGCGLAVGQYQTARFVVIEGVDVNPCGGTHVKNTSELQACKFVSSGMQKGQFIIAFVCGQRLLERMQTMLTTETELTKLLCCQAVDFPTFVAKRAADSKANSNKLKQMSTEIATLKASSLPQEHTLAEYHWEGGELAYLTNIALNYTGDAVLCLTTMAGAKGEGFLMLTASKESKVAKAMVDNLAKDADVMEKVKNMLDMTGGGGKGRWQGKGKKMENYAGAVALLKEAFLQRVA